MGLFDIFTKKEVVEEKIVLPECDCQSRQIDYLASVDAMEKRIKDLREEKLLAEQALSNARIAAAEANSGLQRKADEELAKTKFEHKKTVENIKHLQAMLDEKASLEKERAIFDAQKAADTEIIGIRKEYSDKLETDLKSKDDELSKFMNRVMENLPNVNVQLGKSSSEE